MIHRHMIRTIPLALLCAACTPTSDEPPGATASDPTAVEYDPDAKADLVTQLDAPTPDYAALAPAKPVRAKGEVSRERTAAMPANGKEIGETWRKRLEEKGVLDGYGLEGKGENGPISSFSTVMTAKEFDAWVAEKGWAVPRHFRWDFVPELIAPVVTAKAAPAIKYWPASKRRTGMQLEALLAGRVFMRDGCFWVSQPGAPEKLAWFLAETGLDRDDEGYLVLVDRYTGELRARLGEEMVWGGPNAVDKNDDRVQTYMKACDGDDVVNVGNPEAAERMYVRYPHTRTPRANPTPPGN